jgi:hypothetical protein
MRFTTLPLLFLMGTSVLALPVENASPTAAIEQSMKNVITTLNKLTDALSSINPRMSSLEVLQRWPEVERRCHDVSELLASDARNIRMVPKLAITDSANLLGPIDQMERATTRSVDQWIAIKPAINARDRKGVVGTLKHHEVTANEYAEALLSVQSTFSQPAGRYFGSRVTSTIERAIQAYS